MRRKITYSFVQEALAREGYQLLEETYRDAHQRLKCVCPKGHETTIQWSTFDRGVRCAYCHGNVPPSYEQVKQFFVDAGCELLEDRYVNNHTLMRYRCICGRESQIRWSMFKNGQRCCGKHRNAGPNHPRWNPDRHHVENVKLYAQKAHDALKCTLRYLGKKKKLKSYAILGYGYDELKQRIESHPNWSAVKDDKWSLDHMFPVKAFVDYGITDVRLINSLDNLQPLILRENVVKNDTYIKEDFENWLREHDIL